MGRKLVNYDANMKMCFIIDDVNMPKKDTYGIRGTDEFFRYYLEYKGLYDKNTLKWTTLDYNPLICIANQNYYDSTHLDSRFCNKFLKF